MEERESPQVLERRSGREKKESARIKEAKDDDWANKLIRSESRTNERRQRNKPDSPVNPPPDTSQSSFEIPHELIPSTPNFHTITVPIGSMNSATDVETLVPLSPTSKSDRRRATPRKQDGESANNGSPRSKRHSPNHAGDKMTISPSTALDDVPSSISLSSKSTLIELVPAVANALYEDAGLDATAHWTGEGVRSPPSYCEFLPGVSGDHRVFYPSIIISEKEYKLFDHVIVRSSVDSVMEGVARIVALFMDDGDGRKYLYVEWYFRKPDVHTHLLLMRNVEEMLRNPQPLDDAANGERRFVRRGRPPKKRRGNIEESLQALDFSYDHEIWNAPRPHYSAIPVAAVLGPCVVEHVPHHGSPTLMDTEPGEIRQFMYRRSYDPRSCNMPCSKPRSNVAPPGTPTSSPTTPHRSSGAHAISAAPAALSGNTILPTNSTSAPNFSSQFSATLQASAQTASHLAHATSLHQSASAGLGNASMGLTTSTAKPSANASPGLANAAGLPSTSSNPTTNFQTLQNSNLGQTSNLGQSPNSVLTSNSVLTPNSMVTPNLQQPSNSQQAATSPNSKISVSFQIPLHVATPGSHSPVTTRSVASSPNLHSPRGTPASPSTKAATMPLPSKSVKLALRSESFGSLPTTSWDRDNEALSPSSKIQKTTEVDHSALHRQSQSMENLFGSPPHVPQNLHQPLQTHQQLMSFSSHQQHETTQAHFSSHLHHTHSTHPFPTNLGNVNLMQASANYAGYAYPPINSPHSAPAPHTGFLSAGQQSGWHGNPSNAMEYSIKPQGQAQSMLHGNHGSLSPLPIALTPEAENTALRARIDQMTEEYYSMQQTISDLRDTVAHLQMHQQQMPQPVHRHHNALVSADHLVGGHLTTPMMNVSHIPNFSSFHSTGAVYGFTDADTSPYATQRTPHTIITSYASPNLPRTGEFNLSLPLLASATTVNFSVLEPSETIVKPTDLQEDSYESPVEEYSTSSDLECDASFSHLQQQSMELSERSTPSPYHTGSSAETPRDTASSQAPETEVDVGHYFEPEHVAAQ